MLNFGSISPGGALSLTLTHPLYAELFTMTVERETEPRNERTHQIQDCLARVRSGDEDAAGEMVKLLYPHIIRIVRAHLPRRVSEEDIAQDIFIKIFNRLDQYRGDSSPFEHWIARVAHNTCLDHLRIQMRRPELRYADLEEDEVEVLMNEHALSGPQSSENSHGLAAREILEKLFATLSAEDQMVLRMLDLEEMSVAQISKKTGWNQTLIKVRAWRARRKLQATCRQLQSEGRL
ncbi:MAG TPA: RNA polymerase sigma factor [Candidatus Methylacidiphilales bacterium]|nr:RNA polymerase sigma factor [Candidatus Methylacidiphilales bacterium]